jgi:hypothetical protein
MALKPNQLQIITIDPQANAISEQVNKVERTKLCTVNDMIRSFELENNNKILEMKIHLMTFIISFNQLYDYQTIRIYNTAGNTSYLPTFVW